MSYQSSIAFALRTKDLSLGAPEPHQGEQLSLGLRKGRHLQDALSYALLGNAPD
jgi:hypothetical protein